MDTLDNTQNIQEVERVEENKVAGAPIKNIKWSLYSFYIFLATAFLFPIFFIPSIKFPFPETSIGILSIGIFLSFIIYSIGVFQKGTIGVTKSSLLLSFGLVALFSSVSSLLSGVFDTSFFGLGFGLGTASSILLLFLVILAGSVITKKHERVLYVYSAFFLSFVILAVYHLARLFFGADFMDFGIFVQTTSSTLGRWSDLGIFFTIASVLSLVSLELLTLGKKVRLSLNLLFILSLVLAIIVNFNFAWYGLLITSVVLWLSKIKSSSFKKSVSIRIISAVVISLIFIFAGTKVHEPIAQKFNLVQIDVRPSFQATVAIGKESLSNNLLFGIGPNRFAHEYLLNKPAGINQTIYWSEDFNAGIGFIPTMMITTGLLGIISWILFIVVFLYAGLRMLLKPSEDILKRYISLSSYLVALFLWFVATVSLPGIVIVFFAALFTGIFIASRVADGSIKTTTLISGDKSKNILISKIVTLIIILASLCLTYSYFSRLVSLVYFKQAINSVAIEGNIAKGESYIMKAIKWQPAEIYYGSMVEIGLVKLGQIVASSQSQSQDAVVKEFQAQLDSTLAYAKAAVELNPSNYQNWLISGKVFESIMSQQVGNSFEGAVNSYLKAAELNPSNPLIYLLLARVHATQKNYTEAKSFISKAIEVKGNYTEAVYLLAQIQLAEGNTDEAIRSVEIVTQVNPYDPNAFFELGLLTYNTKKYKQAAEALTKAVELNPQYANARYFLGLTLVEQKKNKEALEQFEVIRQTNPDNQLLLAIISNLQAGKKPFDGIGNQDGNGLPLDDDSKTESESLKRN